MAADLTASLVLALLVFSFSFSVSAGQTNIRAEPGETANLTCKAAETKNITVVEWSRPDLELDQPVLLYKDNRYNQDCQSQSFKNRVDLLDVKNGDVSLVLKNVTTDDTGRYECRIVQRGNNRRKRSLLDDEPISVVNLKVEPGNKDGRSWTGLIVGLPVFAVVALLLVAAVLYKRSRGSSQKSKRPPAAADVEETLTGPDE